MTNSLIINCDIFEEDKIFFEVDGRDYLLIDTVVDEKLSGILLSPEDAIKLKEFLNKNY